MASAILPIPQNAHLVRNGIQNLPPKEKISVHPFAGGGWGSRFQKAGIKRYHRVKPTDEPPSSLLAVNPVGVRIVLRFIAQQ